MTSIDIKWTRKDSRLGRKND